MLLELSRPFSRRTKVVSGIMGALLAAGGAYAATNWAIGLNSGSSGEAQSATVSNLTISAVASPAANNLLYPGGNGDVVLTITNPNPFPVTITGVTVPTNATFAGGFTGSNLATPQTGCSTSTSDVIWNYSGSSNSAHTFTTPIVVAANAQANDPLTVTLTNDASMTTSAPAACEGTYFSMPSLISVAASAGGGTVTTSPTTDAWTS